MISKTKVERTTVFTLNEEEAIWLKMLVQNYLGAGAESIRSKQIRGNFWNALTSYREG